MNSKLKSFFIVFAKNAVNAAILSLAIVYHNPGDYNYTTAHGIWDIFHLIVIPAVAIREGMIWIPLIIKWSTVPPDAEE